MNKLHIADAVFVLTTMIVCSSLLTTMAAVTLFPEMMASPFPVPSKDEDCPLFCTEMHHPICASNGTANSTFGNECFMKVINCRFNMYFKMIHEGECRNSLNTVTTTDGINSGPEQQFLVATTPGTDQTDFHSSFQGLVPNSSSSINDEHSYQVYENIDEYGKLSTSNQTAVPPPKPLKFEEGKDDTSEASTIPVTQHSLNELNSSSPQISGSTTPTVLKDVSNSTSSNMEDLELSTKYYENGPESTSGTV